MKNIILVRHGKAQPIETVVEDSLRKLTDKGVERTRKIAKFLRNRYLGPIVDLIVSSRAVRAVHTAKIIAYELGYNEGSIRIEPVLYDSESPNEILKCIKGLSNIYNSVMLVGHDPEISELVHLLSNRDILSLRTTLHLPPENYIPTSGLVSLTFDAEYWSEIPNCNAFVDLIIDPKILESEEEASVAFENYEKEDKTFQVKNDTVKVKDLIEHLKSFDPDLPITYDTMEIGPVSFSRSSLNMLVRIENIDYVDDRECEEFKSVMIG